jgi:hypothetical protein
MGRVFSMNQRNLIEREITKDVIGAFYDVALVLDFGPTARFYRFADFY